MQTKEKAMEAEINNHQPLNVEQKTTAKSYSRRRCLITVCGTIILLILILSIILLVLALTVFKPKDPKTEIISAALDGISPSVTLPAVRIELNVTLDLKILVRNRNHASFRHGTGKSVLLYRGKQVGEVDIAPGNIPARGSATLPCRLTIEVDKLGSEIAGLIGDVLAGELMVETQTRIPGRLTFLGFIKKHAVAVSVCQFTISVREFKVQSQLCKSKAKI
ncbi:uncharacterized protein LOC21405575 [Morus notabilis]|nr:uncharacterized protein LOC21405575 [Morus notabilis]